MDPQTMTLIAAVVAAAVTITSLLLNSRLTLDREKRLVIWRKEVDRIIELEELAGKLVEDMGGYHDLETVRKRVGMPLELLEAMGGRLSRYPKVRQSARDLHNVLNVLFFELSEHNDVREARANLEPSYRMLLDACDEVLASDQSD